MSFISNIPRFAATVLCSFGERWRHERKKNQVVELDVGMARALRLFASQMAKNILIVDDDRDLRRIFTKFLQSRGYETSEAATGGEAIETAIAKKPNLILLDLKLPDMKGTDAAQAIRKHPRTAHIPIIACSAYSDPELRQEVSRLGVTEYLQKPFSAAAIVTIIEQSDSLGASIQSRAAQNKQSVQPISHRCAITAAMVKQRKR